MIGGEFCKARVEPGLFNPAGQTLTPFEREGLWRIFQAIGRVWDDLHPAATDSANLKSSWLDFLEAKLNCEPRYVAEYSNAVQCVEELIELHGEEKAFTLLFLDSDIPEGLPLTRLAHAKKFVVNEFIRVNVVASGFKSFGRPDHHGKNYKGYLGGSRYNLLARVKSYEPDSGGSR